MTSIPSILVVGARDVTFQLSGSFPPPYCRVLHAANVAEALNYAANASIIIVDTASAGGALDLCRRLRADAVTAHVPLVLRFAPNERIPQALTDAAVSTDDYDGLVRAIRQLVPDVTDGGAVAPEVLEDDYDDDDDELFDDGPMTVVWRRPDEQPATSSGQFTAAAWPPPPPEYREGQERMEYALNFSGYLNALIEALEDPSRLSEAEHQRLCHVSHRTPEPAERCLDLIQTAINTALMSSDLEGMRVLSQAKNALYEKVQRLRTLLQEVPDVPDLEAAQVASAAAAPVAAPAAPRAPNAGADGGWEESDTMDEAIRAAVREVDGQSAPGPAPGRGPGLTPGAPASSRERPPAGGGKGGKGDKGDKGSKSALTLAAEAKEREDRKESKKRAMEAAKRAKENRLKQQYTAGGSAKKGRGLGPTWVWVVVAVVVVAGSGAWITINLMTGEGNGVKIGSNNAPPRMVSIALEQTSAGIIARPTAKDDEGDRVSFSVRWFLNGSPVPGRSTARMGPQLYHTGDQVIAEVRPRDMHGVGPAMSSKPLVVRDLRRRPPPRPKPTPKQ